MKIIYVTMGLLAGLFTVLFVNIFIQWAAATVLLDQNVQLIFFGIRFIISFEYSAGESFGIIIFITALPVLISIIIIEASIILFAKSEIENLKIPLLIFQLINTGFIIVNIISGIITIVFNVTNSFSHLLKSSGYSYTQQLLFMLVAAFILFGYLNFSLKRMKRNIPATIDK